MVKKSNCKERRQEVLKYLNQIGGFGLPSPIIDSLAERYNVSERMIYKDIQVVMKRMVMPEILELSKKFALSFKISMRRSHHLAMSDNPTIQAKGIHLINETIGTFTSFLENFGLKERLVEKRMISTDMLVRKEATPEEAAIYEEFYDEHGKRRNQEDGYKE